MSRSIMSRVITSRRITSRLLKQARKLACVSELLEREHSVAQLRDLRLRQRLRRELLELGDDVRVGGEVLLAAAAGLHGALQHRAVVQVRLGVYHVAEL